MHRVTIGAGEFLFEEAATASKVVELVARAVEATNYRIDYSGREPVFIATEARRAVVTLELNKIVKFKLEVTPQLSEAKPSSLHEDDDIPF